MHASPGARKRRDDADPVLPPLTIPAIQSDLSKAEPTSSHSSGSSSDSHSSGDPNSSSSLSPTSQSKVSSGSQSILLESSPDSSRHNLEVSFTLPPPIRSIPLKRHSPLNPTSFPDLTFPHPKPQSRPGINPLTQGHHRTGSLSAASSSSGSRLLLSPTTYENVFFPRSSSYAVRSSASSTLGGSTISLPVEFKYESLLLTKGGVFIPFPSNLHLVDNEPMDEEDMNFTSDGKIFELGNYQISARGLGSIVTIVILVVAILALFVIYPVFSFYLYDNLNAAVPNGNSTDLVKEKADRHIINARDQSPLFNQVESHGGKYPSSIFKAGLPEYESSFSEEWELEGRHFGPDQDEAWVSLINDDASTTRKGYLILGQQAHLKTRVPHCLGNGGFIDVSFATENVGKLRRAYWTGNWSAVKDDDEDGMDVLKRSGVERPVMVTLHIEFVGGVSQPTVGYVRFYSLREPYACEDDAPELSVHLDLGKPLIS